MPGTDPVILKAPEYPGGRLDWQHFDFVSGPKSYPLNATRKVRVMAAPLRFAGQPAARWWEMEEGVACFGNLSGGEGDLARSVLAAYAAVAGGDWYFLPCRVPSGALARVRSLNVLDNFGAWTRIASCAAGDAEGDAPRVWRWFEIAGNVEKDPDLTPLLFVPPVAATTREGDVLEEVHFRRDDMANLAWAIEARYQGIYDRAVERSTPLVPTKTLPTIPDDWTYRLGTDVPGNWFPLLPVRITGALPQIVLRRGMMVTAPDATATAGPFGMILLPGRPFLMNEAEVPAAGARVTRRYQTARSADGGSHLWAARLKTPSTGPMTHSPLEYDALAGWSPRTARRGR